MYERYVTLELLILLKKSTTKLAAAQLIRLVDQ